MADLYLHSCVGTVESLSHHAEGVKFACIGIHYEAVRDAIFLIARGNDCLGDRIDLTTCKFMISCGQYNARVKEGMLIAGADATIPSYAVG